jgi:flagellar motility protein MotE (MotC chaperone)
MRRSVRWFLITVLLVDASAAAWLLTDPLGQAQARAEEPAEAAPEAAAPPPDVEALHRLGLELAQRAAEIDRREAEIEELLRGQEVLRRAGLAEEATVQPASEATAAAPETQPAVVEEPGEPFKRLQRAYENMEPESAAKALEELAARDRDAVVELLLGWPPRTSGAILDALTQTNAALAADLSYEVWKRSGKGVPRAASSGR